MTALVDYYTNVEKLRAGILGNDVEETVLEDTFVEASEALEGQPVLIVVYY